MLRKKRLTYFLKQLSLNLNEFAAEIGIEVQKLKEYEEMLDTEITQTIIQYFKDNNTPQVKSIIYNFMIKERGKLHLDDYNIYEALSDYLSYAAPFSKYAYNNGICRLRYELFCAHSTVFYGVEQVITVLDEFGRKSSILKGLGETVILYNAGLLKKYGLYEEVSCKLATISICLEECIETETLPSCNWNNNILTCIYTNHFLLKVTKKRI